MADRIRRKNFDQICRLCLEYASDENILFPLFINEVNCPGFFGRFIKEFKESIPEIITTCTGVEIDPNVQLPLNICSTCETQLISANQFREKCLQSNEYLFELRLTGEDDDLDTDDDKSLDSLQPEFILFDNVKEDSEDDYVEMESSCDSVQDNLETQMNVEDKTLSKKKLTTIKSESRGLTTKTADKLSTTIPLIEPTIPIVSVYCNEMIDPDESLSSNDQPKESIRHRHAKIPKMCTVCGIMVVRLRDHMRAHPKAMEHCCLHCPKRYLTSKGLSKHIRILHTEETDQSSCDYSKKGEETARKPLASPQKWSRNMAKTQRNFGQSYVSTKGIARPERKMKEPCNNICRMKCTAKITNAQREAIFKDYWNISDLTQKRVFLIRHIERIVPKYRRSTALRSFNYAYFFEIDDKRIQVCKTFFQKTLDISHMFIQTAIKKFNSEKGCLEGERRGKWRNEKT